MLACWNLRSNIGLGCWHGLKIFCGSDFQQSLKLSVCLQTLLVGFHKISKISHDMMMPKMFVVLALLAHGAVAVRSNTWLSEGQSLELEKVEKRPRFVEKIFKKGRSLKGWIARKLGKKKIEEKEVEKREIAEEIDEEKLVDKVQKVLQSEEVGLDINATRRQVEEFIRKASPILTERRRSWTWLLREPAEVRRAAKLYLPLDRADAKAWRASAAAFCGELVKVAREDRKHEAEAHPEELVKRSDSLTEDKFIRYNLKPENHPEELCERVLTGNLSEMSGPMWAVEAAQVAEMDGQQHPYGRLDGVAWKHSLKRVCHDECEALAEGIRYKARELADSAYHGKGTIQDACTDHVVKHVEAEILGCCSRSCGWNGQFCAFFPFLNSTQQDDWQAECCTERNILNGSSRQRLCDSTLSQADKSKSEKIVDKRPNSETDRKILGQDESQDSESWSLMESSFGGSVDHNKCPTPIDLHKIYKDFFQDWKRMPLDETRKEDKFCEPNDQASRGKCKAFLLKKTTDDEGREKYNYNCWDACGLKKPKNPKSLHVLAEKVKDEVLGIGGFLFVHKEIYSAWKWT